jgi:hypothetical protein
VYKRQYVTLGEQCAPGMVSKRRHRIHLMAKGTGTFDRVNLVLVLPMNLSMALPEVHPPSLYIMARFSADLQGRGVNSILHERPKQICRVELIRRCCGIAYINPGYFGSLENVTTPRVMPSTFDKLWPIFFNVTAVCPILVLNVCIRHSTEKRQRRQIRIRDFVSIVRSSVHLAAVCPVWATLSTFCFLVAKAMYR